MTTNNTIEGCPLPHNTECEQAVIGACINEPDAYSQIADILSPHSFYDDRHRTIFNAIISLFQENNPIDIITVSRYLESTGKINEAGGESYIMGVCSNVISSDHIEYHARIVAQDAQRRQLILFAAKIKSLAYQGSEDVHDLLSEAQKGLSDIMGANYQSVKSLGQILTDIFNRVNDNISQPERIGSTPTGFPFIDTKGGFQPSNLIVIAGATSMGKTSFAMSIARRAVESNRKVAFYSLEMTQYQIVARLLSKGSGIAPNRLLNDPLDKEELCRFDKESGRMNKYADNLLFDDRSCCTVDSIIASIRALKKRNNIDGVFIDYLQILNVNQRGITNREQLMGDVARKLKNLAKDLNIWIVALSQLNRDKDNPSPNLDRLRDSGQIAEAADIVMLIYRAEMYRRRYDHPFENIETSGTALINVAKGRNVGVGSFIAGFDAQSTFFYPLDKLPTSTFKEAERANTEDEPF